MNFLNALYVGLMSLLKLSDPLIGKVTGGAVTGLNGTIWSTTPGFYGNPKEFAKIAMAFKPNSECHCKGIPFQGETYLITVIDGDIIVAQHSNHSLVVAKCPKCLIFGFHDDRIPYAKCAQAVSDLAARFRTSDMDALL
jgi:hypothetical protein